MHWGGLVTTDWLQDLVPVLLGGAGGGGIVGAYLAVRKDRREGKSADLELVEETLSMVAEQMAGARSEAAAARAEAAAARVEAQAVRADLAEARERISRLEDGRDADRRVIAGLRGHIDYLSSYISEHLPDGPRPRDMPEWLRRA